MEVRRIISTVIADLRDKQGHWYRGIHVRDMKPASRDERSSDKPQGPETPRAGPVRAVHRPSSRDAGKRKLLALVGYAPPPPTGRPRGQPHVRPVGWATGNRPPTTPSTSARSGPRILREETPNRRVVLQTPPVLRAPHATWRTPAEVGTAGPPTYNTTGATTISATSNERTGRRPPTTTCRASSPSRPPSNSRREEPPATSGIAEVNPRDDAAQSPNRDLPPPRPLTTPGCTGNTDRARLGHSVDPHSLYAINSRQ
ncbi:basic salivary proline-rich protein 4-like [Odontomachus brunneus]|uniref:basic salivary proline-rich protein 4-like n=1 Tax=Odontomachus brunneus TaxID=486640 RepID=UPI0013F225E2|nr:basic salivary proline-rich protein 4-like [Odontomachus brunneus]